MLKLKNVISYILLLIILAFISIGAYYPISNYLTQRNINKIEAENDRFFQLLNDEGILYNNYILYEEIWHEDDTFYLIFTEESTEILAEGETVSAILIVITSDIKTEYVSSISKNLEGEHYILPSIWIAGGGSAPTTVQAFFKRAELRRLILENHTNINQYLTQVKIEDSFCLGKIEF